MHINHIRPLSRLPKNYKTQVYASFRKIVIYPLSSYDSKHLVSVTFVSGEDVTTLLHMAQTLCYKHVKFSIEHMPLHYATMVTCLNGCLNVRLLNQRSNGVLVLKRPFGLLCWGEHCMVAQYTYMTLKRKMARSRKKLCIQSVQYLT